MVGGLPRHKYDGPHISNFIGLQALPARPVTDIDSSDGLRRRSGDRWAALFALAASALFLMIELTR